MVTRLLKKKNAKTSLSGAVAACFLAAAATWPHYREMFLALATLSTVVGLFLAADASNRQW